MELLVPDMLDKATAVNVQKAMAKDLGLAAKKLNGATAWFAIAEDVVLSDKKKITVFVAVKNETEAKAWATKFKSLKPRTQAQGTCVITGKDGAELRVAIDKVTGDRKNVVKALQLAFKLERLISVTDATSAPATTGAPAGADAVTVSPKIDAMVAKVPVPEKAEILALLKEFEGLGLSERDLQAALRDTFSRP